MEGIFIFPFSQLSFFDVIAVCLVDDDEVGHFHDPSFNALKFIATAGKLKQGKKSTICETAVSDCPTPTVSTMVMSKPVFHTK